MVDFGLFDSLLDSVLIINKDKGVIYCNETAAALLESSVRRLSKGKPIYEIMEFDDAALFPNKEGTEGKDNPLPLTEVGFKTNKGKKGKVQIVIQPFTGNGGQPYWVLVMRDVTLEEVLHGKYKEQLDQKEVVIEELRQARAELEAYSKNLEQMVEERTAEIKRANGMLNAIMNSLGQGFLVFDREGVCSDIYTRACEEVLEVIPKGKKIWDVLKLKGGEESQFKNWMTAVFSEALPFDSLKDLAPSEFNHSRGRKVDLEYYAIKEQSKTGNLVLVATDNTNEYEAQKALEKEKQYAQMVLKLVTNKKQFSLFLENILPTIEKVKQLAEVDPFDYSLSFRILHTLEGEAGAFSANSVRLAARKCQEVIEPLKFGENGGAKGVIDNLLLSLNELEEVYKGLLNENSKLFSLLGFGAERTFDVAESDLTKLAIELERRNLKRSDIDYIVTEIRREPIGKSFTHYQEIVDQICDKQNKSMQPLEIKGGEIRVSVEKLEDFLGSLVHAIRNAMDHGIETPDEREAAGKPRQGRLTIFVKEGVVAGEDGIIIRIKDDGRGIDPAVIRKKAIEKNLHENPSELTDEEVLQLIFSPGFSSKEEIGEFSGRGIGMDAIRYEVRELGGDVWVTSKKGAGTELHAEIPLTSVNVENRRKTA